MTSTLIVWRNAVGLKKPPICAIIIAKRSHCWNHSRSPNASPAKR